MHSMMNDFLSRLVLSFCEFVLMRYVPVNNIS